MRMRNLVTWSFRCPHLLVASNLSFAATLSIDFVHDEYRYIKVVPD